ncbi:iron uptake transporter permease EfeU [Mycolicibacterium sp. CBM1]
MGTFLIGLREGLEATLIVSIVGAFLRRNGRSVRPMLVGVGLAVTLSMAVGVGLDALSASLPQRQQEMLETVIGAAAVAFVTSMIIWMNRAAHRLKGELEHEAAQAINTGSTLALVTMAFLAVIKEGFETAVFLLAAAQATHSSGGAALLGAVAGIAVAIAIGVGIYFGGLKLNLGRFFRITGVFLVFIAAGLVVGAVRTAHEAGWIDIGQQRIFDLSSWIPPRSVRGALVTGMFGIPSDPRLIDAVAWLAYAVPVLAVVLRPARLHASPTQRPRLLAATSAALAVAAALLVIAGWSQHAQSPGSTRTVTLASGGSTTIALHFTGDAASLTVGDGGPIALTKAGSQVIDGLPVTLWQKTFPANPGAVANPVSLAQLANLTGGRLPVGLSSTRTPGPFQAQWTATISYCVSSHGDSLVSGQRQSNRVAVLRGGGLSSPKTVSLGVLDGDWSTTAADDAAVAATVSHLTARLGEQRLWRIWLPLLLAACSVLTAVLAYRAGRSSPTSEERHDLDDYHHPQPSQIGTP